jgi:hypothetical protein
LDRSAVAKKLATTLEPYLPELLATEPHDPPGMQRSSERHHALTLWERLGPALRANPALHATFKDWSLNGQSDQSRKALNQQLTRLLSQDHNLAADLHQHLHVEGAVPKKEHSTNQGAPPQNETRVALHRRFIRATRVAGPGVLAWMLVLVIAVGWLAVALSRGPGGSEKRLWLVVLLLLDFFLVLRLVSKGRSILQWFFNLTALVTAIAITALLPALLFGRADQIFLLKLLLILILSLFPGWLYLQFVMAKGKSLREEFILNLFRLHIDHYKSLPCPPRDSIFYPQWRRLAGQGTADNSGDNIYLRKLEAAYGKAVAQRSSEERPRGDSLFPVILTTMMLAVGWAAIFQPEIWGNWHIFTGLPPTSQPQVIPVDALNALRFGFAGAYWFILQMLIRRYFQNDLKTDAYISAAARIVVVLLLITVLHAILPARLLPEHENALAFMVGIFPQIGLQAIQNFIALPLKRLIKTLEKKYPLSDLDGLNIWYEARLIEEGIEDMQNLASANLVDVMLHLRVPVERLIDWVDQAHLYLRVSDRGDQSVVQRGWLRTLGIRTATDLENVFLPKEQSQDRRGESRQIRYLTEEEERQQLQKVREMLGHDQAKAVWSILRALDDEINLWHIRQWKAFTTMVERTEWDDKVWQQDSSNAERSEVKVRVGRWYVHRAR